MKSGIFIEHLFCALSCVSLLNVKDGQFEQVSIKNQIRVGFFSIFSFHVFCPIKIIYVSDVTASRQRKISRKVLHDSQYVH